MEEIQDNMEDYQDSDADLMYEAHAKVDALIDLLVKKGIINEEEYDKEVEKLLTDLEADDEEDDEEHDGCCSEHTSSCGGCASE